MKLKEIKQGEQYAIRHGQRYRNITRVVAVEVGVHGRVWHQGAFQSSKSARPNYVRTHKLDKKTGEKLRHPGTGKPIEELVFYRNFESTWEAEAALQETWRREKEDAQALFEERAAELQTRLDAVHRALGFELFQVKQHGSVYVDWKGFPKDALAKLEEAQ